jgi:hypothetical protein
MKIGDTITCIDTCYAQELIDGGEYRIVDINERGNLQIQTIEDYQTLSYYYDPDRFELIVDDETTISNEIVVDFGGIKIRLYDDRSVLFGGSVPTVGCSDKEIDNLIRALLAFRNGETY